MPPDPLRGPEVDVVVAVHTVTRPIARAVDSVLAGTTAATRVTVIAHNIDPDVIAANLGDLMADRRVRLLSLHDSVPSPAGPFNLGLDRATAPFVSVMGSDDTFDPGAVDSWLSLQRRHNAGMVLARIRHDGGGSDSYPPVRLGRTQRLDGVKDRLSYRSAPLGLISRQHFGDLRFSEGLPSGEDLAFVTRMWFSGVPLAFDSTGPAYVGHHDEGDRVTSAQRDVSVDFRFLDEIYPTTWFARFTNDQRTALAAKFLRMHVFDAILARSNG
ncbi:glycosyltransferase family A protein, partial [Salinibacterium sp.]|uniref:glycosyltransferase family A protein n=1 Tax=Salinibacterium sp. TaxID=1915057 RepID=UPI00286C46BF